MLNALRILVTDVRQNLPSTSTMRYVLDQWPAFFLVGVMVVAILSLAVYFFSSMSLDKLQPDYAMRAINSMETIDNRFEGLDDKDKSLAMEKMINAARKQGDEFDLSNVNNSDIGQRLDSLSPEVYLQVIQKPAYQLRSNIINPTVHALNIFQLFTSLMVAFFTVVLAAFCVYIAKDIGYPEANLPSLGSAFSSLYYAIFFFSLYSICFFQYSYQITKYIGSGNTVMQGILAAIVILIVLLWLNSVQNTQLLSIGTMMRFIPIFIIGTGYASEALLPQTMQQLIGKDTNWGIQIIIVTLTLALGSIFIAQIWLKE